MYISMPVYTYTDIYIYSLTLNCKYLSSTLNIVNEYSSSTFSKDMNNPYRIIYMNLACMFRLLLYINFLNRASSLSELQSIFYTARFHHAHYYNVVRDYKFFRYHSGGILYAYFMRGGGGDNIFGRHLPGYGWDSGEDGFSYK